MNDNLALVALAALLGAAIGVAADRLSTRWPAHEEDYVRRPLDWRTLIVAAAGAAVFAALAGRWVAEPRDLAILGTCAVALIVLLATDLDQKILPDLITLPLIGVTAAALVLGWSPLLNSRELGLVSGIAAGLGAPAFLLVSDRVLRGDLGAGDLKLAVSVGLLTGVTLLITGLLVASILFSAVLLALMALRRIGLKSAVPFGPVLILAAFVAIATG